MPRYVARYLTNLRPTELVAFCANQGAPLIARQEAMAYALNLQADNYDLQRLITAESARNPNFLALLVSVRDAGIHQGAITPPSAMQVDTEQQ